MSRGHSTSVEASIAQHLTMHQEDIVRGYTDEATLVMHVAHNFALDQRVAAIREDVDAGRIPEGAGRLEMQALNAQRAETRVLADS